jgi:hypothetical protein
MRNTLEKRRHTRVPARFPVKFFETPSGSKACQGALSKDLSAGGLRFYTECFLPRDTRVFVEFSLPEEETPIKTFAKVAWMRSLPAGEKQVLLSLTNGKELRPS